MFSCACWAYFFHLKASNLFNRSHISLQLSLSTCYQRAQFSSMAQSCLTLCNPNDYSMPGFHVHHQLPRACSSSRPSSWWYHPTISSSIVPFSSHLQSFPASGSFPMSVLCIRWPKYWSFSFSISPSNEYSGLISFRTDWFDLLAVLGTLKSLPQHYSSKASILRHSAFFTVQLSHPYMTTIRGLQIANVSPSSYIWS